MLSRGVAVRSPDGRCTRMAGSLTDITEGKVADALTGLPNRVLFLDRLDDAIPPQFETLCEHVSIYIIVFHDQDLHHVLRDPQAARLPPGRPPVPGGPRPFSRLVDSSSGGDRTAA